MLIYREIFVSSAHKLDLPYKSKCKNLHGHTWRIEIWISGNVNENGMVLDFAEIKKLIEDRLDHVYLNDKIQQPTAENIVKEVMSVMKKVAKRKVDDFTYLKVRVWENPIHPRSYAEEDYVNIDWLEG